MTGQAALLLLVAVVVAIAVLGPLPRYVREQRAAARRATSTSFDRHAEEALRAVAEVRR